MPTFSPQEGLSGLRSGEALAPERNNAQAVSQEGNLPRFAIAKKVGRILAAAGLIATATGCNNGKIDPDNTEGVPTATTTAVPPVPPASPFDGAKLACANMGLIEDRGTPAAENYRRMFVQTVVAGEPVLYEPCAESAIPGEIGRFVQAECKNNGNYRACVLKDTFVDNSYSKVNTETHVQWLLNGHNKVESAQTVGRVFPMDLYARYGLTLVKINKNFSVVHGQRRVINRQQSVTPTPPAPTHTAKTLTPQPIFDSNKDTEQDRRLGNLESQGAQNAAKNKEQDATLNNQGNVINIILNNKKKITDADWNALGSKNATNNFVSN